MAPSQWAVSHIVARQLTKNIARCFFVAFLKLCGKKLPDMWITKNDEPHNDNAPAHCAKVIQTLLVKQNTLLDTPYLTDFLLSKLGSV